MHAEFVISAADAKQFPRWTGPEIAMVGRSNCGKSSLLNALMNRKDLARVSRTPGRTQLLNFFKLNQKILLADLPGYGFSAIGDQKRHLWHSLVREYFEARSGLRIVFLIDGRRELDQEDIDLLNYLQGKHHVEIVVTKADKLSISEQQKAERDLKAVLQQSGWEDPRLWTVSALKGTNIEKLRRRILSPN
jgi:GTP-binding protein